MDEEYYNRNKHKMARESSETRTTTITGTKILYVIGVVVFLAGFGYLIKVVIDILKSPTESTTTLFPTAETPTTFSAPTNTPPDNDTTNAPTNVTLSGLVIGGFVALSLLVVTLTIVLLFQRSNTKKGLREQGALLASVFMAEEAKIRERTLELEKKIKTQKEATKEQVSEISEKMGNIGKNSAAEKKKLLGDIVDNLESLRSEIAANDDLIDIQKDKIDDYEKQIHEMLNNVKPFQFRVHGVNIDINRLNSLKDHKALEVKKKEMLESANKFLKNTEQRLEGMKTTLEKQGEE